MKTIQITDEQTLYDSMHADLNDTVWEVVDGFYTLRQPIVLNGVRNFIIHGNENVTFSGGAEIAGGFVRVKKGENVFCKKLNATPFKRLFCKGTELARARFPKRHAELEKEVIKCPWSREKRLLTLPIDYLPLVRKRAEINVLISWIHCVDAHYDYAVENGAVTVIFQEDVRRRVFELTNALSQDDATIYFENDSTLLERHGDWCYDAESGTLFLCWEDGDVNDCVFTYPVLENLLFVEHCENVHIAGIDFVHANWSDPLVRSIGSVQSTMYQDGEVLMRPPGAVTMQNSNAIHLKNCSVSKVCATGVNITTGCCGISVEDCLIQEIGGNGIMAGYFGEDNSPVKKSGLPYLPEDLAEVTANIRLLNNRIRSIGCLDNSGTGIAAGFCRDLYIQHNELTDIAYSGIAAGWGWRNNKPFSVITNFQIKNNKIINYLNSHFNDGAGIYVLGGQSGEKRSVIAENLLIGKNGLGVLYLDEGASNYLVQNNVLQGDAVHGLLYCHDIGNDLHDNTMIGNYAVRDYSRVDFHMDPNGISQKDRHIRFDGLTVFDPDDIRDEKLKKIMEKAGNR